MAKTRQSVPDQEQRCNVECACDKKIGGYFKHYDVSRCSCGRAWWAVRPLRSGPLELKPWPGPNFTRAEMEGKA